MSATNSAPHVSRTYGKRSLLKRKQTKDPTQANESIPTLAEPELSVKRRRLSLGLETDPDVHSQTASDVGTDSEIDSPQKPPVKVVYGSSRKLGPTQPVQLEQQSPSKLARDLTVIFDAIPPLRQPPASPSKLSKRMLARAKTDSSVDSQSKSPNQLFERTPSLPNLPSPSKDSESSAPTPKVAGPIVPLIPPISKTPVTRTYAGKFRSFLVPLPPSSNDPLSVADEEDEFDTRESYTALRNRWGVDVSEDDPYGTPSPSKSIMSYTSTPDASPSRKGRKTKADRPLLTSHGELTLKSISELRHKGESRRFLDEVGYLFEGMDEKGGINLRRASALEITTKLCDPEFTRKGKAADFFVRTWDVFIQAGAGKGEDKILDTILIFFAALVARDPVSLTEVAQRTSTQDSERNSLVDILFKTLDRTPSDADPLVLVSPADTASDIDLKKAGVNKKDRTTLVSVYTTIASKSNLFSPNSPITTSLLVSYTLQNLAPTFISVKYFPSLLSSLRSSLCPGTSTSLKSTLSLNWSNIVDSVAYENIYYHFRILETYLLDQWASSSSLEESQLQVDEQSQLREREQNDLALEKARDTWLTEDLISLGMCIEIKGSKDDLEFAQGCLDTTLRILVSLTHANELWAGKVVQCEYTMSWLMRLISKNGRDIQKNWARTAAEHLVKSEETDDPFSDDQEETNTSALDTLCLALGLLTNLVQTVQEAKRAVRDSRLGLTCSLRKRACAQHCSCPHPLSGIEILGQLYSQHQIKMEPSPPDALTEDSPEARAEAEASFLRGHLAVLFGLLMMNDLENESAIIAALPSPTSTPSRNVNLKMIKRQKMTRLVEQARDFAAFYTAVSNRLGGEQDSKVVKEVVAFLEIKRDSL